MEGHDRGRERRYSIQKSLYEICFFLEFALAILVISFVVIEFFSEAVLFIRNIPEVTLGGLDYSVHLKRALDIVIGIEFIKMLCRHNMDSVIEVRMFAMTRHLIGEETSMLDGLICVVAVSILFVVRKFLFVAKIDRTPSFGKKEESTEVTEIPVSDREE